MTLQDTRPTGAIHFYGNSDDRTEILRIARDGIWANPDIPADDAAKLVLGALDRYIKELVKRVVEDEREACALQALEGTGEPMQVKTLEVLRTERQRIADAIRAKGSK